jgi:DUF1680 family protein
MKECTMDSFHKITRRRFLTTASSTAAVAALVTSGIGRAQDAVADIPVSANKLGYERIVWKIQPFPMTQVRLLPGLFLTAQQANLHYLNMLPNEKLAHMFRVTAGLPPRYAEGLAGWEAPDCELRGHFAGGHYLSACALMYASTHDDAIKHKGDELVSMLVECQQSDGYLGAYPTSFYDRLKGHKPVWAPFYTYHKIMAGMLDMYVHTGNMQALACAEKMAAWAGDWATAQPDTEWAIILRTEHGGMNEVMFNLYAVTGDPRYRDWGYRFEHKAFFDPLAAKEDKLNDVHANTNIPKVIGAARGYELTGDERYHTIADYFFQQVVGHHTYATGGTSDDEHWSGPDQLAGHLGPAAEECCCSYNMMKLGRHIHGWTADARVMDYYERLLFNVRLGTQNWDGMLMYYVSLKPGMYKTFNKPFGTPGTQDGGLWCCTGTGVEDYSKTNDSIYSHDSNSVYVNLFIPSELSWSEKQLTLVQETEFPREQGTTLTLHPASPSKFAVHLRIPYWATRNVTIQVNGKPQQVTATPATYVAIEREWKDGDRIEVSLPMHLHTAPLPDDPTVQAMLYGPLVLAGRMGNWGLDEDMILGPQGPSTFGDLDNDDERPHNHPFGMPAVRTANAEATEWIVPALDGEPLQFRTQGLEKELAVSPLYQVLDERYTVYFKVTPKTA